MNEAQIRIDDCRLEVLNALYHRRTGAHAAETLRSVYLSNRDYSLEEVKTALSDMERLHLVESATVGMTGSEVVWQITGAGITHKEKGSRK